MTTPNSSGEGLLFPVEFDRSGKVAVGQGVAGNDDERPVFQLVFGVLDTSGGAEGHGFGGVMDRDIEVRAVAEVVTNFVAKIVKGGDHFLDPVPFQQSQDVLHDGLIPDGNQRLGALRRERA
jgi:hypothetical protein